MVTFKTKRSDLIKVFKHFYPGRKKYSSYKKENCEITIINAKVSFASRGAVFSIDCITKGTAKITVPLFLLYNYIELDPSEDLIFEFTEGKMKLNTLTVNATTCFFEDDKILRTIRLPINYSIVDLIQLINDHTQEELVFNHIFGKVNSALVKLDRSIAAAYNELKQYGVSKEEIEAIVAPKLFKDGKMPG